VERGNEVPKEREVDKRRDVGLVYYEQTNLELKGKNLPSRPGRFLFQHYKKKTRSRGKCHVGTMMHIEDCEAYKMNVHHVSL